MKKSFKKLKTINKPLPKPKPSNFIVSDKQQKANEQAAAYENDGVFGIGMIRGVK